MPYFREVVVLFELIRIIQCFPTLLLHTASIEVLLSFWLSFYLSAARVEGGLQGSTTRYNQSSRLGLGNGRFDVERVATS
jgi:hypothetical protein